MSRGWVTPKVTRDGALFLLGLTALVHQFFLSREPNVLLIGTALTLLGLPLPLRLDERRRNGS